MNRWILLVILIVVVAWGLYSYGTAATPEEGRSALSRMVFIALGVSIGWRIFENSQSPKFG